MSAKAVDVKAELIQAFILIGLWEKITYYNYHASLP